MLIQLQRGEWAIKHADPQKQPWLVIYTWLDELYHVDPETVIIGLAGQSHDQISSEMMAGVLAAAGPDSAPPEPMVTVECRDPQVGFGDYPIKLFVRQYHSLYLTEDKRIAAVRRMLPVGEWGSPAELLVDFWQQDRRVQAEITGIGNFISQTRGQLLSVEAVQGYYQGSNLSRLLARSQIALSVRQPRRLLADLSWVTDTFAKWKKEFE